MFRFSRYIAVLQVLSQVDYPDEPEWKAIAGNLIFLSELEIQFLDSGQVIIPSKSSGLSIINWSRV